MGSYYIQLLYNEWEQFENKISEIENANQEGSNKRGNNSLN
jgi:hypothetical protein